jgi:hypothetical protein
MPSADVDRQTLVVVYGVPVGQMQNGELTLFSEINGELAKSLYEKLHITENRSEAWTRAYNKLQDMLKT